MDAHPLCCDPLSGHRRADRPCIEAHDRPHAPARKPENLEDNIKAVDLALSEEDTKLLDTASDPGVPYPKWMVLQLDVAEDPRPKVLHPERYADGGPWKDLRGTKWSG